MPVWTRVRQDEFRMPRTVADSDSRESLVCHLVFGYLAPTPRPSWLATHDSNDPIKLSSTIVG